MNSLPQIKIASPCHARWEDMTGDERTRFCGHCEKHVYNLSRMSTAEVAKLIQEKEGKMCARLFQRKDGTLLTGNCPVGEDRRLRQVKLACCSAMAGAILLLGAWLVQAGAGSKTRTHTKVEEWWDTALWKVKGLFGMQPPVMVMGEICIPPAPVAPVTNQIESSSLL